MKNAITRNMADPILAVAPVIPTDTLRYQGAVPKTPPVEDLINEALAGTVRKSRPSRINLDQQEIVIASRFVTSLLKPTVDVYAFYGASGLSGQQNPLCPTALAVARLRDNSSTAVTEALSTIFRTAPARIKAVGVNINVPLRNRQVKPTRFGRGWNTGSRQMSLQQTGEHHPAASAAGPVYLAAELRRPTGSNGRPRLCPAEPRCRTEEVFAWEPPPLPWYCRPPAR